MSNYFYDNANRLMRLSWEDWGENQLYSSWQHAFSARLAYLSDVVVDVVVLPYAFLKLGCGVCHALRTWDRKSSSLKEALHVMQEKVNHCVLSIIGSFIPSITYKYKDANLAPYILALRIVVISGFFLKWLTCKF